MSEKRDPQTYSIIGAAMAVHGELGPGFLEEVYHEALAIELFNKNIPFQHEASLAISYKGKPLSKTYRADFICYEDIIVELKALPDITGKEKAQVINYLKATNLDRGLLFNFGSKSLQYIRLTNNWKRPTTK
jgi:GxxExxY protein